MCVQLYKSFHYGTESCHSLVRLQDPDLTDPDLFWPLLRLCEPMTKYLALPQNQRAESPPCVEVGIPSNARDLHWFTQDHKEYCPFCKTKKWLKLYFEGWMVEEYHLAHKDRVNLRKRRNDEWHAISKTFGPRPLKGPWLLERKQSMILYKYIFEKLNAHPYRIGNRDEAKRPSNLAPEVFLTHREPYDSFVAWVVDTNSDFMRLLKENRTLRPREKDDLMLKREGMMEQALVCTPGLDRTMQREQVEWVLEQMRTQPPTQH